ncbi:hypothetical protein BGZ61DRAFT_285159, partial [Ilyonectria robusta]|uniref:uncharacterized protein n=1 Tax=Ilyonectria robusta TaxID=1079257 RepID=UPI001E8DE3A7
LPATNGYVTRAECFFVSHFWQSKNNPDPSGKYLRLHQQELRSQHWSYIWIDWTYVPQHPRTQNEEIFFQRTLQTLSGLIRNCGFAWCYPPFEARLWILYEVAEFTLSYTDALCHSPDIKKFADHINEMVQVGVRPTLIRNGYRCSYDRDKEYLTSWLEVLVLLRQLLVDIQDVRDLLDKLTWFPGAGVILTHTTNGVKILRFEGRLIVSGEEYAFTPFPK